MAGFGDTVLKVVHLRVKRLGHSPRAVERSKTRKHAASTDGRGIETRQPRQLQPGRALVPELSFAALTNFALNRNVDSSARALT